MNKFFPILLAVSASASAQTNNGRAVLLNTSADGVTWSPYTGAAAFGQLPYTPRSVYAYCQASAGAAPTPCVFGGTSSSTGTVTNGSQYSPAYYTGNGTVLGGVVPFTGLAKFSTNGPPTAAVPGTDFGLGNTTSTALVSGNLPSVTGPNALGDSGVALTNASSYKGSAVDASTGANNFLVTLPGTGTTAYTGGQAGAFFVVKFTHNSTAASNIAINGGPARTIKVDGYNTAADIQSGQTFLMYDDGTNIQAARINGRYLARTNQFYFADSTDPTKTAMIDTSLVTTATSRTYKAPDANGSLVIAATAGSVLVPGINVASVGSSASPSVVAAGAAGAGSFSCAVAASGATCTVNDTAVTANSQIHVWLVGDEGTRLGVTCNTAPSAVPNILLASKTAGTGFTINMPTITTNPACFDFLIAN